MKSGKKAQGLLTNVVFGALAASVLIIAVFVVVDSLSPSKRGTNPPSVAGSTAKWSGTGPDCTPEGHPDPDHPGVTISDRYTDECPEEQVDPSLDGKSLDEDYHSEAEASCEVGADEFVRSKAKFDFKWAIGPDEEKFQSYLKIARNQGVLTLIATKKLELQNAYGAYERVTIQCDYDTRLKKIIGFRIQR
jgi:hypothetical protein